MIGLLTLDTSDSSKLQTRTVPYYFMYSPSGKPPLSGSVSFTNEDLMVTHIIDDSSTVNILLPDLNSINYNAGFKLIIPSTSTAIITAQSPCKISDLAGSLALTQTFVGFMTLELVLIYGEREGSSPLFPYNNIWVPTGTASEGDIPPPPPSVPNADEIGSVIAAIGLPPP